LTHLDCGHEFCYEFFKARTDVWNLSPFGDPSIIDHNDQRDTEVDPCRVAVH